MNDSLARNESEDSKGDVLRNKIVACGGKGQGRPECDGFVAGVMWVYAHLAGAAKIVVSDVRGDITGPNGAVLAKDVIVRSGDPTFANLLRNLADALAEECTKAAREKYPDFDAPTEPMKKGQSSGL